MAGGAPAEDPPDAIDDLVVTASPTALELDLEWTLPVGTTSVKVYRHTASFTAPDEGTLVATLGVAQSYTNSVGVLANTEYFFQVIAGNEAGDADPSNEDSDTTLAPPAAINDLNATASTVAVEIGLEWTLPMGATLVKVYRHTATFSAPSGGTLIATLGAVEEYTDEPPGMAIGTQYFYELIAGNGAGDAAASNEDSATTLNVPDAIDDLAATADGQTKVDLAWTLPALTTGVKVYRHTATFSAPGEGTLIATLGAVTAYEATGLTMATEYFFEVIGFNAAGDAAASNEDSATTAGPTGLTRTTAGLVNADAFNRTDEDPPGAPYAEIIGTTWLLDNNRIEINTLNATLLLQDATAEDLGKMFVQGLLSWAADNKRPGLVARWDFGTQDGFMVQARDDLGTVHLWVFNANSATQLASAAKTLAINTAYPVQLYVADGVQEGRFDDIDLLGTNTDQDGENARGAGMRTTGTSASGARSHFDNWLWCRDKVVIVSGLPPGWKAKIRNAVAAVVAEATANGSGIATIDASMNVGNATEIVPLAGWTDIQITNAADVEQFVYSSTTAYPGDIYAAA